MQRVLTDMQRDVPEMHWTHKSHDPNIQRPAGPALLIRPSAQSGGPGQPSRQQPPELWGGDHHLRQLGVQWVLRHDGADLRRRWERARQRSQRCQRGVHCLDCLLRRFTYPSRALRDRWPKRSAPQMANSATLQPKCRKAFAENLPFWIHCQDCGEQKLGC